MNLKTKLPIPFALGMALVISLTGVGRADVIYDDQFSRTASLDGTKPAPTDPSNQSWSALDGTSSTLTTNGSAAHIVSGDTGDTSQNGSTGILPLTLQANTTYQASIDIGSVSSDDDTQWLAAGFTTNATSPPVSSGWLSNGLELWVLYRANGGAQGFSGGGTSNAVSGATSVVGTNTLTFILNTGTGAFSITDSLDGLDDTGTLTSTEVGSITGFGIGDLSNQGHGGTSGTFDNLVVQTTPEPSSIGLLMSGLVGLVALIRMRKSAA